MNDFTITILRSLIDHIRSAGYTFQTFEQFIKHPEQKVVILRHDIDDRKEHALVFAKIQQQLNIKGTYYFRMVPQSYDHDLIREILELGHEIGYHYEDMDFANGDTQTAINLFKKHLKKLRKSAPVSTICMHGSPQSKYDNKDIWKDHNYQDHGIIAEPYFDLDFDKVFYLTDTGRRWDGHKVSVRDKVKSTYSIPLHSTNDIIAKLKDNALPDQIMINFHPQRWTDDRALWVREKYIQKAKNAVKYQLIKWRAIQHRWSA